MILYFKRLICLDVVEIEVLNTTEQVSCEGGGKTISILISSPGKKHR